MINKIQKPKTKQDLIKAINQANIKSILVYEGEEISRINRTHLDPKMGYTVIFLK